MHMLHLKKSEVALTTTPSNRGLSHRSNVKHYSAARFVRWFMGLRIEWRKQPNDLGEHRMMLFALPGVGNVGKTAIDGLTQVNQCEELVRLHHTALPPLAELDEDGLLTPPHLSLSAIESSTGVRILTLSGTSQPLDPEHQGSLAHALMHWLSDQGVSELYVLAGLMDSPTRKECFIVPSSKEHRINLETAGVDVRRDEPSSGAIGLTALMASLGPLHGIHSACAIATTVGSSGDVFASQRLLEALDGWFDLGIALPADAQAMLSEKLASLAPKSKEDYVAELTESPDAFYM